VNSLRTKIFLLVVLILALVAGSVMFFSKRGVETAMLDAEERSARNVLHLLALDIDGRYKTLLRDKVDAVTQRKSQVKNLSSLVLSGLRPFLNLAGQGVLSSEKAKTMALDWIVQLQYKGAYIFVFNDQNQALYHPEEEYVGKDLSHIKDIKGREMLSAVREEAGQYGSAFAIFHQQALGEDKLVKQFADFVYFSEWGWLVGVAAYIQDVEEEVARKSAEMLEVLRQNVSRVHIAETGFVFLFSGEKEFLVLPPNSRGLELERAETIAGGPLLEALMQAAQTEDASPVDFVHVDSAGQGVEMESYASYFKPMDWYIATVAAKREIAKPARDLLANQGAIFGLVLVVGLVLALAFSARISGPLTKLADYAKVIPEQDLTAEPPADSPIQNLSKRYRDEVGRLAESFVYMERSLRENIRNLIQVTAAKQRIENELSIARDIQMGLLHKIFPPFPDRPEFDLYAYLEPAKEVGGDLYDFFFIDDNHLCFSVGDVSDKGVPAALFMAISKALINVAAQRDPDPASMMCMVNDELARDNPNCMFVTLIIAIIDLRSGDVRYANGGHNRPVLLHGEKDVDFLAGVSGPMAGAMADMPFSPLRTKLEPGDTLLLYTDGVTEAMTEKGELFTDDAFLETVRRHADASPRELVDVVLADVKKHVGGAQQSDDITMLCLRYNGPRAA
jgi:phosphoserine phosphatase RsbU/P